MGRTAELLHGHTASEPPVCPWLSSLLGSLEGWQGPPAVTILPSPCRCHQEGAVAGVAHLCLDSLGHPGVPSWLPLGSSGDGCWAVWAHRAPWCLTAQLPTILRAVCTPQTPWGRSTMPAAGKGGTHGPWHPWLRCAAGAAASAIDTSYKQRLPE